MLPCAKLLSWGKSIKCKSIWCNFRHDGLLPYSIYVIYTKKLQLVPLHILSILADRRVIGKQKSSNTDDSHDMLVLKSSVNALWLAYSSLGSANQWQLFLAEGFSYIASVQTNTVYPGCNQSTWPTKFVNKCMSPHIINNIIAYKALYL